MKKIIILFIFMVIGFMTSCLVYVPNPEAYPPVETEYYDEDYRDYSSGVDISYFYDHLSPYGYWTQHSLYGYVWIPRISTYGWRPYTNGRWIWTDYGWTWISAYNWGWAPFHYGRWGWDDYLGWYWRPGNVWGPAWVTWRRGSYYLGWAPLPPDIGFVVGVGISSLPYSLHHRYWIFVENRYFYNTGLLRYVLPRERTLTIINRTSLRTNIVVQNNRIVNRGIDIDHVRNVSNRRISKIELRDFKRPGQSAIRTRQVDVFRPAVNKNERAKPKNVLSKENARIKIEEGDTAGTSSRSRESNLKRSQKNEIKLMEKTHSSEIKKLSKEKDEKVAKIKSSSEKKKIQSEYKTKVSKAKASHSKEKSEIKTRHKKESSKAKKTKGKKATKKKKKKK